RPRRSTRTTASTTCPSWPTPWRRPAATTRRFWPIAGWAGGMRGGAGWWTRRSGRCDPANGCEVAEPPSVRRALARGRLAPAPGVAGQEGGAQQRQDERAGRRQGFREVAREYVRCLLWSIDSKPGWLNWGVYSRTDSFSRMNTGGAIVFSMFPCWSVILPKP